MAKAVVKPEDKPLTGKQQAMADNWLTNGYNGTAAAMSALYAVNAVNREAVCRAIASRELAKVNVKAYIAGKQAKSADKVDVTIEFIVRKLLRGLELAEEKADLVSMARFSELLGKYKAIFTGDNAGQAMQININLPEAVV